VLCYHHAELLSEVARNVIEQRVETLGVNGDGVVETPRFVQIVVVLVELSDRDRSVGNSVEGVDNLLNEVRFEVKVFVLG